MVLADFENLLKETMGLDVASIGSSAIERAVEKRLLACELRETHAYWERVRASEAELQELIEAVVVPETWFFRDREAFAALALTVYEDWLGAHPVLIEDRKSTRLNSSHLVISYAVFCLKKKKP